MEKTITVTREELLTMEHDFITKGLKKARGKILGTQEDEMAVSYDFLIFAEAINDFTTELMGDKED